MGCQSSHPISVPKSIQQVRKSQIPKTRAKNAYEQSDTSKFQKDLSGRNLNLKEETRDTLDEFGIGLNYSFSSNSHGRFSSSSSSYDASDQEEEEEADYSALESRMSKIAKKKLKKGARYYRIKEGKVGTGHSGNPQYHPEESLYTKFFKIKKTITRLS